MSVSLSAEGTQTAVIGTEHELVDDAAGGAYELHVLITNMQGSDTLELRLKEAILLSDDKKDDAQATGYTSISGAAADPKIKVVGPYAFNRGVIATLKQTAGTGRSYKWKLLRV